MPLMVVIAITQLDPLPGEKATTLAISSGSAYRSGPVAVDQRVLRIDIRASAG